MQGLIDMFLKQIGLPNPRIPPSVTSDEIVITITEEELYRMFLGNVNPEIARFIKLELRNGELRLKLMLRAPITR